MTCGLHAQREDAESHQAGGRTQFSQEENAQPGEKEPPADSPDSAGEIVGVGGRLGVRLRDRLFGLRGLQNGWSDAHLDLLATAPRVGTGGSRALSLK